MISNVLVLFQLRFPFDRKLSKYKKKTRQHHRTVYSRGTELFENFLNYQNKTRTIRYSIRVIIPPYTCSNPAPSPIIMNSKRPSHRTLIDNWPLVHPLPVLHIIPGLHRNLSMWTRNNERMVQWEWFQNEFKLNSMHYFCNAKFQ